ncbi:CBFA2T1-like isoform X5 [Paramuricea clavata]|uniref:CBFA2T1-like isoform X5 n=1 Tax=Paramuricea clavata TaxID=317549 RepID=A0A7D9HU61_PARCT|nr:CBFA2T1-like isoform X5 [Paramuricea clavata]
MPAVTAETHDSRMPDSPNEGTAHPTPRHSVSPVTSSSAVTADTRSVSSTSPHVNGSHTSPLGATSPPAVGNGANQLPPACGARQLSKLKRFLTTLQQFGSDISPEIGERVRGLVLNLVNSTVSIEEFHQQLQEATNFPLRPFVIPFLKANLPLLQRELLQCAQMAKQTPHQYLHSQNAQLLEDREPTLSEQGDANGGEFNENGKRKSIDSTRPKENGSDLVSVMDSIEKLTPAKRPCLSTSSTGSASESFPKSGPRTEFFAHGAREGETSSHDPFGDPKIPSDVDDWRHVETMLQCILGMVEKTKRAITVLQQRTSQDREELVAWARKTAEEAEQEVKRRANDLVSKTIKQTEERVSDVKRRAEEAVSDVKRQAVVELQKAVRAAEEKANEAVGQTQNKVDKAVMEARRQAIEETLGMINRQSDSSENCWNCGRKANETCSGCNLARYCGAFCQHKDWENHHRVCGQQISKSSPADDTKKVPTSTATPGKESGKLAPSPGLNRPKIASPTSTGDPITSLSDYVRKTPST